MSEVIVTILYMKYNQTCVSVVCSLCTATVLSGSARHMSYGILPYHYGREG